MSSFQSHFRRAAEDLLNRQTVRVLAEAAQSLWRRPAQAHHLRTRIVPFPGDFPPTGWPEAGAAARVLLSRRLDLAKGNQVARFEEELARTLKSPWALACSSGTAAITLALASLDLGPGDEVVVPAISYMGSAMAVLAVGARPVFADVTLPTGNLCPESLERAISPATRAVMVVHLSGIPAPLERIGALCRDRGLPLVEDTAQGLGGRRRGRYLGTWGELGCFSLNAGKTLTTGQGGFVLGRSPETRHQARLAIHCGELVDGGIPWYERRAEHPSNPSFPRMGWNLKMSELSAAVGRVQLRRLEALAARRERNGRYLLRALAPFEQLQLPRLDSEDRPAFWRLPLRVRPPHRALRVLERLRAEGITAYAPGYTVLADNPVFSHHPRPVPLPGARSWHRQTLLLPTHPNLGPKQLQDVAPAFSRSLDGSA